MCSYNELMVSSEAVAWAKIELIKEWKEEDGKKVDAKYSVNNTSSAMWVSWVNKKKKKLN